MSYFDKTEKIIIFSEHDWNIAKDNKKLSILKLFEKEIARNLGIKSKPQLLLSQNTDVLGSYSSDSNTLEISEPLLLRLLSEDSRPFNDREESAILLGCVFPSALILYSQHKLAT